jgi:[histone H3]-trimethyl-L-lysine4 demethylase
MCPPENFSDKKRRNKFDPPILPEAPIFYPTFEEFTDPCSFIESIREQGEAAGIIKIVPPPTWKCPCPLQDSGDSFSFQTCVQPIDQLQKRAGANARFISALRKFHRKVGSSSAVDAPTVAEIPVDLFQLYQIVDEREKLKKPDSERNWVEIAATMLNAPLSEVSPTIASQVRELYTTVVDPYVSAAARGETVVSDDEGDDSEKYVQVRKRFTRMSSTSANAGEEGEAGLDVVEAFGFGEGGLYTWNEFRRRADQFRERWFSGWDGAISAQDVEREYWRVVDGGDLLLRVEYGSDLDVRIHGSGFPTRAGGAPAGDAYADSPWNLNNLPLHARSLLRLISPRGEISGVSSPWVYVGMLFSSFCWHVEDNHLYAVNYMHAGAPKTWYGVPAADADAFEAAFRAEVPDLWARDPKLLFKLCTMVRACVRVHLFVRVCVCVRVYVCACVRLPCSAVWAAAGIRGRPCVLPVAAFRGYSLVFYKGGGRGEGGGDLSLLSWYALVVAIRGSSCPLCPHLGTRWW